MVLAEVRLLRSSKPRFVLPILGKNRMVGVRYDKIIEPKRLVGPAKTIQSGVNRDIKKWIWHRT